MVGFRSSPRTDALALNARHLVWQALAVLARLIDQRRGEELRRIELHPELGANSHCDLN